MYYADDWKAYRDIIPSKRLIQSKKYTVAIERANSN